MDGHIPEEVGAAALSTADRSLVEALAQRDVLLDPAAHPADLLVLDQTGRTRFILDGAEAPAGASLIGSLAADQDVRQTLYRRYRSGRVADRAAGAEIRSWLSEQPRERVHEMLDRIRHAVRHMAPVLIYVGDNHYSNLGEFSNLPGKSLGPDDERNVLKRLATTAVAQWPTEDACFVALAHFLLRSGNQARLEEVNGTQLLPAGTEEFLTTRIRAYGAQPPPLTPGLPIGPRLEALADTCARERRARLANGAVFYRLIHGVNLNKTEHLLPAPITYADAPAALRTWLERESGLPARTGTIEEASGALTTLADALHGSPAAGFHSAYEGFLTRFMTVLAEACDSDVAMGRGPRSLAALRPGSAGSDDPLLLKTGDFFCCVAPSPRFAEFFAEDRATLVKTLCAYSARMRFNTWHYLPHTLGISDRDPGRDDWFFAPTMPDVTHWSDRHHTGHVTFGVRFAIRVPLGIEYAGRYLPGLYDLRLMRSAGERYTIADLRAALACGQLLAALHQAMSRYDPVVRDFGNDWFRRFYG